jgi:hypothetical protein
MRERNAKNIKASLRCRQWYSHHRIDTAIKSLYETRLIRDLSFARLRLWGTPENTALKIILGIQKN